MNIFTYIQHLYTAFVLCKCVLTYIFSNYYKINKEGRTRVGLESNRGHNPGHTVGQRGRCGGLRLSTSQETFFLPWEGDMFPTL